MARDRRPYLPGGIFHLTARTLRRERLLTPSLRTEAIAALAAVAPRSRARLLAVAVMANHLHLVVQQGSRPLSALMQPLLRRLAHLLQVAHGIDGPIFWRHYACQACLDPAHARNAIAYTHLNPVRAGICGDPADYVWTSHALFVADGQCPIPLEIVPLRGLVDPRVTLPLFGRSVARPEDTLRASYLAFLAWRIAMDDRINGGDDDSRPDAATPNAAAHTSHPGDPGWPPAIGSLFPTPSSFDPGGFADPRDPFATSGSPRLGPDMATIVRKVLSAQEPRLSLESIRGRHGGRPHARVRHAVIRRLAAAGYRNIDIARFLDLSQSAVSKVRCSGPDAAS